MKRLVLLILVLLLMVDLAEDGCLGKATPCLPCSTAKTSVTSFHNHPGSGHSSFQPALSPTDLSMSLRYGKAQVVTPHLPSTLQKMLCCHLGSSGAIPL
jgi:hypothetical protein